MPTIVYLTTPLAETERNARIYAGDILVFRGFPEVAELVAALRAHCCTYLGNDPEQVHELGSDSRLDQIVEALRQKVRHDLAVAELFSTALAAVGVNCESTYGDGVVVRVQKAGAQGGASRLGPLRAHRDTWGSNIPAQTNWWAPLFTTTPERTLALFPAYFQRVVANDSAKWDFEELVRRLKSDRATPNYPLLPTATDPPPWVDALPVNLVPGDLLCFSGAHLHASVPNQTNRTRLSFESRTVNAADAMAGRGAPNVDGRARCTTYQIFKRLTDQQTLGQARRRLS